MRKRIDESTGMFFSEAMGVIELVAPNSTVRCARQEKQAASQPKKSLPKGQTSTRRTSWALKRCTGRSAKACGSFRRWIPIFFNKCPFHSRTRRLSGVLEIDGSLSKIEEKVGQRSTTGKGSHAELFEPR